MPLLVQAIQHGGDAAGTARHSLETVFADGVDQALIDTMKKTEDRGRRALFIEILVHRRVPSAMPDFLQEVASDDGNVRRRAISALGNVAGPEDVTGLIHGLLKVQDAGERAEAGRSVAAVCARIADDARQADPVLDEYRKAAPAEQLVLLPVLGRIGGTKALALIREAVAGADPKRRDSGRQALFNWPDSTVADDLARLAETAPDRDLKIRAIQALARVVILPGDRTDDAKLALLARAMKQADRNENRRLILDRVARFTRSPRSASPPGSSANRSSPARHAPPSLTCSIARRSAIPTGPKPTRSWTRSSRPARTRAWWNGSKASSPRSSRPAKVAGPCLPGQGGRGSPSHASDLVRDRRLIFADFRGAAICLFRTHFLGWSGRFFHGFDGLRRLWPESP